MSKKKKKGGKKKTRKTETRSGSLLLSALMAPEQEHPELVAELEKERTATVSKRGRRNRARGGDVERAVYKLFEAATGIKWQKLQRGKQYHGDIGPVEPHDFWDRTLIEVKDAGTRCDWLHLFYPTAEVLKWWTEETAGLAKSVGRLNPMLVIRFVNKKARFILITEGGTGTHIRTGFQNHGTPNRRKLWQLHLPKIWGDRISAFDLEEMLAMWKGEDDA